MRILVDTSVWSEALRRRTASDNAQHSKLADALGQGQPVALIGVILQEILHGLSDPKRFQVVKEYLDPFPLIDLKREDYIAAAELRNICVAHGVQASTVDFQIAAACIRHDCALLTTDQDFHHISQWCPLQLL